MVKLHRKVIGSAAMFSAAGLVLAGCAAADEDATSGGEVEVVDQSAFEEALSTPTELTMWAWVPDIQNQVDMFMEEYPAIDVTVENVGQGHT